MIQLNNNRNVLRASLRTFFFVSILFPAVCSAQFFDSIAVELTKKPSLTFNFDTRNTFIGNRRAEIFGLKLGLRYGKKFKTGLGYNFLSSEQYGYFPTYTDTGSSMLKTRLRIRYLSTYGEYLFHKSKRWEFTVGLQLGIGGTFYGPDLNAKTYSRRSIFVYEPTISAEYAIFKWLGFGGKYGYRVVFGNQEFTAPIYAFGFSIYWSTIYRGTRDWIKGKRKHKSN